MLCRNMAINSRRSSQVLKIVASGEQESAMGRGRAGDTVFHDIPYSSFLHFKLYIYDFFDKK